jgi:hypothetical protein
MLDLLCDANLEGFRRDVLAEWRKPQVAYTEFVRNKLQDSAEEPHLISTNTFNYHHLTNVAWSAEIPFPLIDAASDAIVLETRNLSRAITFRYDRTGLWTFVRS